MLYEVLLGLHSLSPFFSMNPAAATSATSTTSAATVAPAAPIKTEPGSSRVGGLDGVFLLMGRVTLWVNCVDSFSSDDQL
jgi:hypothetical protein